MAKGIPQAKFMVKDGVNSVIAYISHPTDLIRYSIAGLRLDTIQKFYIGDLDSVARKASSEALRSKGQRALDVIMAGLKLAIATYSTDSNKRHVLPRAIAGKVACDLDSLLNDREVSTDWSALFMSGTNACGLCHIASGTIPSFGAHVLPLDYGGGKSINLVLVRSGGSTTDYPYSGPHYHESLYKDGCSTTENRSWLAVVPAEHCGKFCREDNYAIFDALQKLIPYDIVTMHIVHESNHLHFRILDSSYSSLQKLHFRGQEYSIPVTSYFRAAIVDLRLCLIKERNKHADFYMTSKNLNPQYKVPHFLHVLFCLVAGGIIALETEQLRIMKAASSVGSVLACLSGLLEYLGKWYVKNDLLCLNPNGAEEFDFSSIPQDVAVLSAIDYKAFLEDSRMSAYIPPSLVIFSTEKENSHLALACSEIKRFPRKSSESALRCVQVSTSSNGAVFGMANSTVREQLLLWVEQASKTDKTLPFSQVIMRSHSVHDERVLCFIASGPASIIAASGKVKTWRLKLDMAKTGTVIKCGVPKNIDTLPFSTNSGLSKNARVPNSELSDPHSATKMMGLILNKIKPSEVVLIGAMKYFSFFASPFSVFIKKVFVTNIKIVCIQVPSTPWIQLSELDIMDPSYPTPNCELAIAIDVYINIGNLSNVQILGSVVSNCKRSKYFLFNVEIDNDFSSFCGAVENSREINILFDRVGTLNNSDVFLARGGTF
jgi:hypothetical protein